MWNEVRPCSNVPSLADRGHESGRDTEDCAAAKRECRSWSGGRQPEVDAGLGRPQTRCHPGRCPRSMRDGEQAMPTAELRAGHASAERREGLALSPRRLSGGSRMMPAFWNACASRDPSRPYAAGFLAAGYRSGATETPSTLVVRPRTHTLHELARQGDTSSESNNAGVLWRRAPSLIGERRVVSTQRRSSPRKAALDGLQARTSANARSAIWSAELRLNEGDLLREP